MKMLQFTKIGNVHSPQLMHQEFIRGADIAQVEAGIDITGVYNVKNIQNLETQLKNDEYGYKNGEIAAINGAREKSYEADLDFNHEVRDKNNARYFGQIH
eukprot:69348_1